MPNLISTLQDGEQNKILPRTLLKAVADDNGNYLDNQLTASDINVLKNSMLSSLISLQTYRLTSSDYYSGYTSDSNGRYINMYRIGKLIILIGSVGIISNMVVGTKLCKIPKWKPSSNIDCAWSITNNGSSSTYHVNYNRWILNSDGDIYTTYEISSSGDNSRFDDLLFIYTTDN